MNSQLLISIVDDDPSFRQALAGLARSVGFDVAEFSCAADFLHSKDLPRTAFLLADVRMPDMTGPELHARLVQSGAAIPTALMSAYPESTSRSPASTAGIQGFLKKPFTSEQLLDCIGPLAGASSPSSIIHKVPRPASKTDIAMPIKATPTPGSKLLSPTDHALILIDFQSQMSFATKSIDAVTLRNNAALVSLAAAEFKVPTILTTVAEKSFSGPMFEEITEAFPGQPLLDRTSMNTWEDAAVIERVNQIGKTRLVFAGLWTGVCIVGPTLSALDQGFECYVIADACGDVSTEAHERAMERMIQAGVRPMTSLQYLLELQRDWARTETYAQTTGIAKKYGGAYGLGIIYAKAMFGASEAH